MREVVVRFWAKTPKFFQRLRNLSLALAAASSAAAVFYGQLPYEVANSVPSGCVKGLAIAGMVAAFVAQLTKEDASV